MIKIFSRIVFATAVIFYFFHFLFIWVFETTDSWFYWAFANFIKTGLYSAPHPYYYTSPSTMEPPLYSLFLYAVGFFPRADIVIHLFQILGLFLSLYFMYRILSRYASKHISLIVSSLFLLIPSNIIYASNLLSEVATIPVITAFIFLSSKILLEKKYGLIKYLLIFSSLMTLLRYNLGIFYSAAVILFLFISVKSVKSKGKIFKKSYAFFAVSFLILMSWMVINNKLNGSVGLSSAFGKNIYDRVVGYNKLLPKDSNKDLTTLKLITGKQNPDLKVPWYMLEELIVTNKIKPEYSSETGANNLFLKVAKAALKDNKGEYIAGIGKFYLEAYSNVPPYPPGDYIKANTDRFDRNCRNLGNINFCRPIINTNFAKSYWNSIVTMGDWFYNKFNTILFLGIILPAMIFAIIQGDKFLRFTAILYFAASLFPTLVSHPDPRYIYPLLPLEVVLVFYFLSTIVTALLSRFGMVDS